MVTKADTTAPAAAGTVPYVGPRPFESDDSRFFFGRDREAAELLAQITSYRIVVFYAPSGAGKTSLLNAQVIPQLEAEGFEVLPPTRVHGVSLGELSQQTNPYVVSALSGWAVEEYSPAELAELAELTITGYLAGHEPLEDGYGQPAPRVLVFDQFEELFTAYPTRWQDRESFFGQLREALKYDPWLRIVLSVREDHVAELEPYAAGMPDFLRHRFRLERMRPEAALQAVGGPAQASGRPFGPGAAEKLVEELGQTRVESAAGPIIGRGQFVEPVQLQVVCRNLWLSVPPEVTTISESEIEEYGDVNQALSEYYEAVVSWTASVTRVSQRTLRDWFEKKLITPAKTRGLVFYDQEKRQTAGLDNEAIRELDSQHMIRGEIRAGSRWYELTHDRFIDPILAANEAWRQKRSKQLLRVSQGSISLLIFLLIVGIWAAGTITDAIEGREQTRNAALAATATAGGGTQVALSNDLTRAVETAVAATATQASDMMTARVEAALATRDMQTADAATASRIEEDAQATASVIAVTEIARATTDAQATVNAQELQRLPIRPLRPGISVGSSTGWPGSLSGFALSDDGRLNLVLPATILGEVGTLIIQPSPADGGQVGNAVAQTKSNEMEGGPVIGAASLWGLATLNPNVGAQVTIPGIGPIRGVRPPQPGSEVRIVSRSSDTTTGRLPADVTPIEAYGLFTGIYSAYDDVIPLLGIPFQDGDEGGLVVDQERYAVGVIVGPATVPSNLGEDARLMVPLVDVMDNNEATFLYQGLELATFAGAGRELKAVGFSPDGRWLAAASFDTNVYLWDLSTGLLLPEPLVLRAHPLGVWDLAFSSDGTLLVTAGIAIDVPSGSELYLWDLTASNPAANPVRLGGGFGDLVDVAISPDDRWLAATGANDDIYLWDLSDGANRRVLLNGHLVDTFINELFFSPDGRWLASAGTDQTVRLWDLQAAGNSDVLGPAYTTLDLFDNAVTFVTGSPDGRYLVASSGNEVTVWDVSAWPAAPVFVAGLEGHTGRVTLATFSPDGKLLATADEDGAIRLWDSENFEPIAELSGHSGAVRALTFSPDSAWLASGGSDRTIRLWSMTTARPGDDVLTLAGHADAVRQLAFRPDGLWLASGSDDATLRLWQAR